VPARILTIAVVTWLLVGTWLLLRADKDGPPDGGTDRALPGAAMLAPDPEGEPAAADSTPAVSAVARGAGTHRTDRASRDALHRQILDALERRGVPREAAPVEPKDQPVDTPGLMNRLGDDKAYLGDILQDDFMPLVDECYQLALERTSALAGRITLRFEIVGDESVGGVVEDVEFTDQNQISDPELLECVRETTFSLVFPPPRGSGREGLQLDMHFEPDR
jgi:hypothetical protein